MKRAILGSFFLFLGTICAPATTITITGVVTDGVGSAPFSITVTTDVVTITSMTAVPSVAAPGTARTLTVVGTSSAGNPISCTVNAVPGVIFTPVTGQPAGTCAWTFVY